LFGDGGAGEKPAKQPVFVLTARRTFPGAEAFTCNLKNQKRANWEGTGVEPGVKVAAADALATAQTPAAGKIAAARAAAK
jgi:hypothetical protein